eukprot:scaffold35456_cov157-Isochrysis_galbana.AAC.1
MAAPAPAFVALHAVSVRFRRQMSRLRAGLADRAGRAAVRLLPNTGGEAPRVHPRPLCVAALAGAGVASAVGAGMGGPPLASAVAMLTSAAWEACAAIRALSATRATA